MDTSTAITSSGAATNTGTPCSTGRTSGTHHRCHWTLYETNTLLNAFTRPLAHRGEISCRLGEVAQQIGRTFFACQRELCRLGFYRDPTWRTIPRAPWKAWRTHEEKYLREATDRLSRQEILERLPVFATQLQRSPESCYATIVRLGLQKTGRPAERTRVANPPSPVATAHAVTRNLKRDLLRLLVHNAQPTTSLAAKVQQPAWRVRQHLREMQEYVLELTWLPETDIWYDARRGVPQITPPYLYPLQYLPAISPVIDGNSARPRRDPTIGA